MPRYAGIGHRFWVMFSLLVAAISVVTALGVYAVASSVQQAVARQELAREAGYFTDRLAQDPHTPLPDTWLIRGYLRPSGGTGDTVPERLRGLSPGYHMLHLPTGESTAYVTDGPRGRLYLVFKRERPNSTVMLFGLIPVVLVVLIIYLATWITYRASRRALSPVIALASVVRQWDPLHPDPAALAPGNIPEASDSDVEVLARALYNFANRLEAFVERERNFTRDASHELRTPLTVMKVAADVLTDEENLSPFAQRSLARIRRSVREMEALIEAFLVLARESDTGLRDEDFLVNDVVAAEVARYRELLGDKPVEIVLTEHARFALHAPPRVFAVMIGNLIRNACLYTERGSVTVEIGRDNVRVVDTGSGMSEEDLERAFQVFYRGSRTGGKGHGIGLAIVRRLADRYGWNVSLESTLGQGTTATASFPLAQPPDAALPQAD